MTAASVPAPDEAADFLDFLISRRAEGLALDTFQLAAAMALLGEAWAEALSEDRFRLRLLPVLATSAETRAAWGAALAAWRTPTIQERSTAPIAAPADPPPAAAAPTIPAPGGVDARTASSLAAAAAVGLIGAAAILFGPAAPPPTPPPVPSQTPPSRTLVAPRGPQTFTLVPKTVTVLAPDPNALVLARGLILAAPLLVLALCGLWLRAGRKTLLSSQPRDHAGDTRGFLEPLEGAVAGLIGATDLGPVARDLSAPVRLATHQIDAPRSVRATARRAGVFTSVRRTRRTQPEYLAMIERRSPADHMAMLYTRLVDRLRLQGVDIRAFHYRTDPRFLAEVTPFGPQPADLDALASAREGQRLLVLGDIDAFLQPFSEEPWPWVARFDLWETRALLDPRARPRDARGEAAWGKGETRLADAGWLIGTARIPGLARLGTHLTRPRDTRFLEGRPAWRPQPRSGPGLATAAAVDASPEDDPQTPIDPDPPEASPISDDTPAPAHLRLSGEAPVIAATPMWALVAGHDHFGQFARFNIRGVTQTLRWIPAGTFWMGSPEDEPGRHQDEGPRHAVTLSAGFWLFDTPCTQALWEAVMGDSPSTFKGPDRPVETVSWTDARAFVGRINDLLPNLDLSLPTEAQWEYACRAGTATATYAGPLEVGEDGLLSPALDPIAWYGGNSAGETHPVSLKAQNAWGLFDMLGNVWEWCEDGLRPYGGETIDPVRVTDGTRRVVRGGSWYDAAPCLRAAYRGSNLPTDRFNALGFRCAHVPP